MKKSIILLMLLLIPIVSNAATPWPPPNQPGSLAVTVVASDSQQYLKDWVDPAKHNKVTIKPVTEVKVEQVAYCGFLITGLTPSPKPYSNLQYSVGFKLYGPNGSLLFNEPNYARGQVKDSGKPGYVMADPALDFVLEKSDPAGTYTLEGIATDLVTGMTAISSYKITLIK